jgi:hypothetical protein
MSLSLEALVIPLQRLDKYSQAPSPAAPGSADILSATARSVVESLRKQSPLRSGANHLRRLADRMSALPDANVRGPVPISCAVSPAVSRRCWALCAPRPTAHGPRPQLRARPPYCTSEGFKPSLDLKRHESATLLKKIIIRGDISVQQSLRYAIHYQVRAQLIGIGDSPVNCLSTAALRC